MATYGTLCTLSGDTSPQHAAVPRDSRTAGALYLVVIACGMFAEGYARSGLGPGDSTTSTAARLRAADTRFRLGIAADLTMCVADACLAIVLYRFLRSGGSTCAAVGAALRLVQSAVISGPALLSLVAAFTLADDGSAPGFLVGLDRETRDASAALCLSLHGSAYQLALVVFGASCLANSAAMVDAATPVPTALGVLFGVAGVAYVIDSIGLLLVPAYTGYSSPFLMTPVIIAEVGFCFWLLHYGCCAKQLEESTREHKPLEQLER